MHAHPRLARIRNLLLDRHLHDSEASKSDVESKATVKYEYVLWLDADVTQFPADLIKPRFE